MFRTAATRFSPLAGLYLVIAATNVVGALVAIQTRLVGAGHAFISGSAINAPFPFLVAQLALAIAAVTGRGRRVGTATAAILVALGVVSLLSGFGDGSYSAALTVGQRAIQVVLVTALTLTIPVAAAQVVASARGRRTRPVPASA